MAESFANICLTSDIDTKLLILGDATHLGKVPTGIMALLVPMRSELKTSQAMSRMVRHELMEMLVRYDMEKYEKELSSLGKSLWRVQGCISKSCYQ